ncbi:MAG: TIGR04053 family radical SAM/SPASM domain-containing protein [Planctomycetaceae bacterium]|nr:TIGR04053 family radical SAM/SPASM domain-containing protein [Planctomycetaceae bacterium]
MICQEDSNGAINSDSVPVTKFGRRDFNRSPLIVFYEVTQSCGLVCSHCRACAQTNADPDELTTRNSFKLIDQLAEFPQPPMLVLTGGDPLCRSDIFELIEYATTAGLEVSITPSATPLVTRDAIRRFAEAGIHRMAISIDAATAHDHDEVRGVSGSFERSLRILEEAKRIGLPTQINTTLTPNNVRQIDDMAGLFGGLGITLWSVFFLVPVGRAASASRLSAKSSERAFTNLWRQSRIQPYAIKTTEAPHYRRYMIQQQKLANEHRESTRKPFKPMGVNDGKGIMFIGHTGLIHPSGFLPVPCGAFPVQHLVDIYQNSPIFRGLRDAGRLEGKCGQCEFHNICGGSRARAFAVNGNLFAEEPDCAYIPKKTNT